MKLSAILITKNEARTIARALRSLAVADETIVVDSNSTDKTRAIAMQLGARVIRQDWLGYGPQKNVGLAAAQGDWVLFIDADEELTPSLAQEIKQVINSQSPNQPASSVDFYWLRIVTVFLGKRMTHLYGHNPRLFRKSAGHWTAAAIHEQVVATSGSLLKLGGRNSTILTAPLTHFSHKSIASYLKKMHHYTSLDAEEISNTSHHRSGKPVTKSWLLPYQLSIKQFLKLYFYRRGCLDGYAGFIWSVLSAYYEWEMARKYLAA